MRKGKKYTEKKWNRNNVVIHCVIVDEISRPRTSPSQVCSLSSATEGHPARAPPLGRRGALCNHQCDLFMSVLELGPESRPWIQWGFVLQGDPCSHSLNSCWNYVVKLCFNQLRHGIWIFWNQIWWARFGKWGVLFFSTGFWEFPLASSISFTTFFKWSASRNLGHSSSFFFSWFSKVRMFIWMLSHHLFPNIPLFLSPDYSPLCALACAIHLHPPNLASLNFNLSSTETSFPPACLWILSSSLSWNSLKPQYLLCWIVLSSLPLI